MPSLLMVLLSIIHYALSDSEWHNLNCPVDFKPSTDKRCYWMIPNSHIYPNSYDQQLAMCHGFESDLPSITSAEEQLGIQYFRDTVALKSDAIFYIGLECKDNVWKWSDQRAFNAALATTYLPDGNPTSCMTTEIQHFVITSSGNWTPWTEASYPEYILCVTYPIIQGNGANNGPGKINLLYIVIPLAVVAGVSVIACTVWLAKRKNVNKKESDTVEEETRSQSDEERFDGWEIDRQLVAVEWDSALGKGAFGNVFLGRLSAHRLPSNAAESIAELERNGDRVAVKMLIESADSEADLAFRAEIELMKRLGSHERLVNMLACVTESSPTMLVAELCSKGDLLRHMKLCREYMLTLDQLTTFFDYDQIITEKQQLTLASHIAEGMEYLSNRCFVHRDIAARNILVDQKGAAKIGDFGLCRKLEEANGLYLTRGGRLPIKWMAPESLRNYEMSTASDVWSYGILLFEIVTLGGSPYAGWSMAEILPRLEAGERMLRPDSCPDVLYNIMRTCWMHQPTQRPSFRILSSQLERELSEMHDTSSWIQLDETQHYYHVVAEDDEGVPEEILLRHAFANSADDNYQIPDRTKCN